MLPRTEWDVVPLRRCVRCASVEGVEPTQRIIDEFDLPDGRHLVVRTASAADAGGMCELYRGLTLDDRHRRFFGAFTPHLEWCREWATVAERGGFCVVAIVTATEGDSDSGTGAGTITDAEANDGVVVGEAGYAMRSDGDGDLALTVAAPWRGWLGPYLLDVLVRAAADAGVRNLQAEVLLENGPMLSLLRRRDPVSVGHDDGMVRLSIGTTGVTAEWPPGETRPRVLVEVAGRRWSGEQAAESAGLATALCAGPGSRVRHRCPVLDGGSCPLAQGADAIVMLLDPDDETSRRLVEAHRRNSPGTPVLVRDAGDQDMEWPVEGCVEIDGDGPTAVAQVVSLLAPPRS